MQYFCDVFRINNYAVTHIKYFGSWFLTKK